jgi:hypothetical protein
MQVTEAISAQQSVDGPTPAELRLQRNMKIVVASLAVLLFAGLATVVGRVIYLASRAPTQPAAPADALGGRGQTLALPAGAQIRSMSLSGNRLAVHYEAPGAEGIAVLDLQTGETITSVGISRGVPVN